jgi:cell wall-associated NlpC family hydrolase
VILDLPVPALDRQYSRRVAGRILIFLLIGLACAGSGCSDSESGPGADADRAVAEDPAPDAPLPARPQVVQALPPGAEGPVAPPAGPNVPEPDVLPEEKKPAAIAATDAELKRELAVLRRAPTGVGGQAVLQPDGTASPPIEAPPAVQEIIHAGNLISNSPYKWGGGHGRWLDDGYDCSGSVSFALFAGGLLGSPLTSGGFINWGEPGPGRWITIYTNPGHIYMVVAGLRFDTSGRTRLGSRWQTGMRPPGGFVVRHPPGL